MMDVVKRDQKIAGNDLVAMRLDLRGDVVALGCEGEGERRAAGGDGGGEVPGIVQDFERLVKSGNDQQIPGLGLVDRALRTQALKYS
ncbi:hypothetical protein [Novosphingobium sp. ST904]|uniref:hypothetical protein n=1 Tax=Novosphingobium sp. ST904 TaxID=1684385 RepID=UPI000A72A8A1|nr:hypothetical protein [Novosphingobium sp. ST904]